MSWMDDPGGKPSLEARRTAFLLYVAFFLVILLVLVVLILFFGGDCPEIQLYEGVRDGHT